MNWVKIKPKSRFHHVVDLRYDMSKSMPPFEAALFVIGEITKNYKPPYTLMLSGGIDSQAMLWAWHKSGVDFKTRTVRYTGGLNDHDLIELEAFAIEHGIKLNIVDFDLLDFLHNEYDKWAIEYDCSSPQICTYMKMCDDIPGTVVFSGNYSERHNSFITYTTMGLSRYAEKTGKSIIPFFFMEHPILAFSFINIIEELEAGISGYDKKYQTYIKAGFPVIKQPTKYTGFEKAKDYYDVHYKGLVTVQHRLRFADKASKRSFDLLLRYPYEEKLNNPQYIFVTNWTKTNT